MKHMIFVFVLNAPSKDSIIGCVLGLTLLNCFLFIYSSTILVIFKFVRFQLNVFLCFAFSFQTPYSYNAPCKDSRME
jgi:hypothetical protein